ncbi:MAG TPA: TonB family protein [Pyrinomonadaceae bacterium]|jgi:TonB family protein|nr:TonB family protein [Pyrinomonadaceae bacterium]
MTTLKQFASPTKQRAAFALTTLILSCACLFGAGALMQSHAQETPQPASSSANGTSADTARGIELYKAANYEEAIKVLRQAVKERKQDAQAWLHLGIALSRAGQNKEARKAFEKASKLQPEIPQPHIGMGYIFTNEGKLREAERAVLRAVSLDARNAEAHYALAVVRMNQASPFKALEEADAALSLNPNFGAALILKKEAALESYVAAYTERSEKFAKLKQPAPEISPEERERLDGFLKVAADSLEKFLKLFPTERAAPLLREELETLRLHAELNGKSDAPFIYKQDMVTTKADILSKPEPLYTEEARHKQISGMVRLRMVLSFDGKVRHILVLKALKGGLTEMAVNAARGIKFKPAIKDGRPVSQFVTIEYNFHIY